MLTAAPTADRALAMAKVPSPELVFGVVIDHAEHSSGEAAAGTAASTRHSASSDCEAMRSFIAQPSSQANLGLAFDTQTKPKVNAWVPRSRTCLALLTSLHPDCIHTSWRLSLEW
jgi:hypothetical protein